MAKKNNNKKILWVEDEKRLIDVYTEAFDDVNDIDIEFMQSGQQAVDRIEEIKNNKAEKPDLIMLDLLLPDINGDKICGIIKSNPETKNIPVFIVTNYSDEQMQSKMIDNLDVEGYLVKTEWGPIKLVPLIKKVLKLK